MWKVLIGRDGYTGVPGSTEKIPNTYREFEGGFLEGTGLYLSVGGLAGVSLVTMGGRGEAGTFQTEEQPMRRLRGSDYSPFGDLLAVY